MKKIRFFNKMARRITLIIAAAVTVVIVSASTLHRAPYGVKITDRDGCIGCGACVGIAPEIFFLSKDDGKVGLWFPFPDEGEQWAKDAADACPVCIIEVDPE